MNDKAKIMKRTYDKPPYVLRLINERTGSFFPHFAVYFDTREDAEEYAKEQNLEIGK